MLKPEITYASNVEQKKISSYLKKSYPDRTKDISTFWQWLYKSNENKFKSSYLAILNNEIVGHAASIPTKILTNGKIYTASWFVDFVVNSNIRNAGIGKKLTKKWMDENKIGITFCNDQSARVFKKFGWNESYDSFMHYFFINPFNHQKFIKYFNKINFFRIFLNQFFRVIFLIYYYIKSTKKKPKVVNLTKKNIFVFINEKNHNKTLVTFRDSEYMNWKFLNSPEYNFYKKFTNINNDSCIIKIRNDKKNSEHIDLLLFEDNLNLKNINALIADVCLWATNKNYAYVRMHTSNIKQKNLIKRKIFNIVRENRFLYYCKDDELNYIFKNNLYDWVLSDSDYDVIS